jgi:hypothetical protein
MASFQIKFVGKGADIGPNPGGIAWSTPGNITADDGNVADFIIGAAVNSPTLRGTMEGNNFTVPGGATILGVQLRVKKSGPSYTDPDTGLSVVARDVTINLVKASVAVGDNKANGDDWNTALDWATYGGSTDLWGTTWTPAEVNDDNFGADLVGTVINENSSDPIDVDVYELTVFFSSVGDLTAYPETTNDFGNVLVGAMSATLNITVINQSASDIIVSALAYTGDFNDPGGAPALPFTLLANNASGPVNIPVRFDPTMVGLQDLPNALIITHDGVNNPLNVEMKGTGILVVPAFTVNSGPLVALVGIKGSALVLQMNPDDLNCEEVASFERLYDYGAMLTEKTLTRLGFRCEDQGAFTFGVSVESPNRPTVTSDPVTSGTGSEEVLDVLVDLEVSDDLLKVIVTRDANNGPMIINGMAHKIEPRGEYVERT